MKHTPLLPDSRETALGCVYLALYTLVLPGVFQRLNMLLPIPLPEVKLNFLFFLVNLISVVFIAHRFLLRSLAAAVATVFRTLRIAGIGLLLYWCATFLLKLLTAALRPDFVNLNDSAIAAMSRDNFTLMSIGTVFLVPPVEEFLYRGVVFGRLYRRGTIPAYLISTCLFSAIHVAGYIGIYDSGLLALSFLQYIPAGLLLAWAYARSGNLWAPILMHMTINQIGMQTVR